MTWVGFLNCYKRPGMTSRDVVNQVQRKLKKVKVGHAGTLDPIAEGVLVLGVGPATRLMTQIHAYQKQYIGHFRLGESSPSQDIETEISRPQGLKIPERAELDIAAQKMIGKIQQTPSAFSAIHINGKRAYERARSGEKFVMPSREVQIYSLEVIQYHYPDLVLKVDCGTGTYIRSVGADLASQLGSCAVMTSLKRTSVGPFRSEHAIDPNPLQDTELINHLQPATMAVEHLPKIALEQRDIERIYFGQSISLDACKLPTGISADKLNQSEPSEHQAVVTSLEIAAVNQDGNLLALLRPKNGNWHPFRVFPPAGKIEGEKD